MALMYVYGYRPSHSNFYFYVSIGPDPEANFERDMKQEKDAYGRCAGNKEVHRRINYLNKQVKLGIIATTERQDVAHALKNVLLYYCQKSVIFNGNQLTKANFVILMRQIKQLYKSRDFELIDTALPLFNELLSERRAHDWQKYKNWPSDKELPDAWVVVDGYVLPEEFSGFMPPVELLEDSDGRIYLSDNTYWNLKKHKME